MEDIETGLIDALQPIRGFVLASSLYHFFEQGLYDALSREPGKAVASVRARTLLQFLANEGYVRASGDGFALSPKGVALGPFRGWFTMLIGGYGSTFLQMGELLEKPELAATRDAGRVGVGSCAISHYDAIPLTRSLMRQVPGGVQRLLDLGCGNALYLVEFCRQFPEISAWGVEPDRGGYEAARALVLKEKMEGRIQLTCASALEFFRQSSPGLDPQVTVLGFVLHEILGQEGKAATVAFLRQLVERFPRLHLIVIEVDNQMDNPAVMRHGLSLAYYNAYYLLHPFTRQRLERRGFWEELFREAGLTTLAVETTDPGVDSTGLEVGYLLRARRTGDA